MKKNIMNFENVALNEQEDALIILDQTKLPCEIKMLHLKDLKDIWQAIYKLQVRGAPAMGIAAGFGLYLAAKNIDTNDYESFFSKFHEAKEFLNSSRPTAVNLSWALNRMEKIVINNHNKNISEIKELLREECIAIKTEDIFTCKKIGEYGLTLIKNGDGILTHCNAGALATGGYGTALGVVRSAYANDPTIQVFADETRPRQQGARLTTFELTMDGIPTTLITDGMCSYFMSKGMIDMVVVGADRIAANGDTANKIGTYTVAIAAKYHNVPFYIAAPLSTIDTSIKSGKEIPIEERSHDEVTHINGKRICAEGVNIINPGFDVTPNELITGIITEKGILRPDYTASIKKAVLEEYPACKL